MTKLGGDHIIGSALSRFNVLITAIIGLSLYVLDLQADEMKQPLQRLPPGSILLLNKDISVPAGESILSLHDSGKILLKKQDTFADNRTTEEFKPEQRWNHFRTIMRIQPAAFDRIMKSGLKIVVQHSQRFGVDNHKVIVYTDNPKIKEITFSFYANERRKHLIEPLLIEDIESDLLGGLFSVELPKPKPIAEFQ